MQDKVAVGVVALVLPLMMIAGLSTGLHYFVAKKEPPHRRAALTVGPAYLITSVALIIVVPWPAALLAPLAAIPAGLFMLLYWRSEFRRRWAEQLAEAPDGDEWGAEEDLIDEDRWGPEEDLIDEDGWGVEEDLIDEDGWDAEEELIDEDGDGPIAEDDWRFGLAKLLAAVSIVGAALLARAIWAG